MEPKQFKIDEFSTGIGIEWRGNNSWRSAGYTHKYINSTLDEIEIPPSIVETIDNKVFEASSPKGYFNDEPAILGRLIDSNWAVVVLITRAIDNTSNQRSLPVSRYFVSKGGISALLNIIDNLENYHAEKGRMPVFDPHGDPNNFLDNFIPTSRRWKKNCEDQKYVSIVQQYKNFIQGNPIPIVLPIRKYSLKELHTLAVRTSTSEVKHQPLSWAYNVESLERPDAFLLIQPASQKAEDNFNKSRKQGQIVVYREGVNDQKLKNNIEAVVDSSGRSNSKDRLKTALQKIEKELNNSKITPEVWLDMFASVGAAKFPRQNNEKSIHPETAKYLILKPLIIPKEFPKFVSWYAKIDRQSKVGKTCSQFLQELKQVIKPREFPKLSSNLKIAIEYSLANLIVYGK